MGVYFGLKLCFLDTSYIPPNEKPLKCASVCSTRDTLLPPTVPSRSPFFYSHKSLGTEGSMEWKEVHTQDSSHQWATSNYLCSEIQPHFSPVSNKNKELSDLRAVPPSQLSTLSDLSTRHACFHGTGLFAQYVLCLIQPWYVLLVA